MNEKKCFKCLEVKPLELFYKHAQMKDGHLNKCIECAKKDVKIRSIIENEKVREYDRQRNKTEKRKKQMREKVRSWNKRNPEGYRAHYLLSNAIRDKRIKRPENCEICGVKCITQGHHTDYKKPLFVVWLCAKCHGQIQ